MFKFNIYKCNGIRVEKSYINKIIAGAHQGFSDGE
jgi:hypothetical protein